MTKMQVEEKRQMEVFNTDFDLENNNSFLLRRAYQRSIQLFQRAMIDFPTTPPQMAILAALQSNGAISQVQLSRIAAVDPATLSPTLKRLENLGLIERVAHENDQRINQVILTQKGIEYTQKISPLAQQASEDVLSPLTPRERKRFISLLKKLR